MIRSTSEAKRARRGVAVRHVRGPALTATLHRRIVAGSVLLMVVVTLTPATALPALFGATATALGLFLVSPAIATVVAFAAVCTALWTSSRYVALLKRSSVQSLSVIKRFNTKGHQSIYDPETGFCTASYFLLRLDEELARSERNSAPFSLLLLDPHLGNSELLHRQLHLTLEHAFRTADLIGRLGDERIAVLLVDSGVDGTNTIVERLSAELGRNVAITSAVYPEDGTDRQSLIAAIGADQGVVFPDSEAIWSPDKSTFDRDAA